MSLDEVYEAIKDRGLLHLPTPITKLPNRRDRGRYCKFHGTHGHTTTECRDLKTQVEDLVRNRYLDEFMDGTFPMVATTDEGEQGDRILRREQPAVRVIAGGPTLAGDSNRSRKNYARYAMTSKEVLLNTPAAKRARVRQLPIMWTDEDEEEILYPHEDALVIRATVASKKFDRILVDTGSSVDVLFKSTLEEMGIADRKLEYTNTSLKGFGGGKLVPLGVVELPITIGSPPTERTVILDFVVVDEEVSMGLENPGKTIRIGSRLKREQKQELVKCLQAHADVFAWIHEDMPGIDPEERYEAVNDEVEKLLRAGFIREVSYPEWISNVMLVKKANGKWRMCVDFTDLNKACPKDSFPLPRIDQLVDSTAGHGLLSFMDAFSGYNQIPMYEQDEESTAFITNQGLFCYRVMPFGLKNAGATYQRLVNKVFKPLIGKTMEVYVDDMITKSKIPKEHVRHLEETFELLRKYKMKLNPEKCAFGVESGKFLGFMVSHRGIEANPEKIQAIVQMTSPRNLKEMQSLTGRLAALSRFISKATDKCQPFFQVIRRGKKTEWTPECEEAFRNLKQYLQQAPLLSTPRDEDKLYLYLAVSDRAASSVLVREEEGVQYPIYYTSKALLDAEARYPPLEKWALALVVAARKLRPYFQAFPVSVITNQPLRQTLHKPDASGRLVKWAVELSEFDIDYKPRAAIKAQVMADFVAEFTEPEVCLDQQDAAIGNDETQVWQMCVDGSSGERGSGAGIVLEGPEGEEISYAVKLEFAATNNQAEYEALIAGLELAKAVKADRVKIRTDSQLVANHVSERFQPREEKMEQYLKIVRQMMGKFEAAEVIQIPREQNSRADILARMAAVADPKMPKSVPLEVKSSPSIEQNLGVLRIEQKCSWRDPIVSYLRDRVLPPDKLRARKIRAQASRYTMIDGDDADYVLREVHEGICRNHSGGRSLAHKVLRHGYFWPTMHQDAQKKTRGCASCQSFANFSNQPPEKLTSMASPWPFAQWGIDLIGPLPKGRGAATHAIVAIDYFTKWIEVEALSRITEKKTTDFVWRNLENDEQICLNLDLLTERREQAAERSVTYQQRVARYYNQKVNIRQFRVGDWVLRRVNQSTKDSTQGVLGPNWEGPYRVK
ncbi:uncharacterized protein LOC112095658 [Citrus clementina]|uniref:uncharacterized protein LOC112095658 n=1 Tax=Citrus clementina TaxID=85681 RepID=UPI000CED6483|nr:uncharacterized protein LOC112095658 [Citrus x clementina]